jgi:predicted DNA-binding transcriptional regulator AlpA
MSHQEKTADTTKEPDEVSEIALVSARTLAKEIEFSVETINDWVRRGIFPKPIVAMPGSPRRWRLRDVEAWIEKRKRARNTKPAARGRLRQYQGGER